MAIFKRKKKQGSTESFKLVSDFNSPHVPFGTNISKSDVVKIAIDRIASQCAKLKPRYIKTLNDKTVTEKSGRLSFILKHKPNEVMTPYQFIYKTITTLLMNDNAFIYPMFDSRTLELKGLYPLTPSVVEVCSNCKTRICDFNRGINIYEEFRQYGELFCEQEIEFNLSECECLGVCTGPVVRINGEIYTEVDADKVESILNELMK